MQQRTCRKPGGDPAACLIVHAEFDYTPLDRKEEYAARIPNARIGVIAGARHAVSMDRPAEFNRMVLDFIGEVDSR